MKRRCCTSLTRRRGLSLLELILALSITAIVAMAISGMMGAVTAGVAGRRDTRSTMVRANAAASRLASYIAPSSCFLDVTASSMVLWFNDTRQDGKVQASEVRWLSFDAAAGEISVHYVHFPESWSQAACDLEDLTYPSNANWSAVLSAYQAKGFIATRTLVDNLASVTITKNQAAALNCTLVSYELGFQTEAGVSPVTIASMLSQHRVPTN